MVVREERQGAESKGTRAKGGTGARTLCTSLLRALSVLCVVVWRRARGQNVRAGKHGSTGV
jgi:hypothetical protein